MPVVQGQAQGSAGPCLYVSVCHQHQAGAVASLQQWLLGQAQLVCDASAKDATDAGDGLYAARQVRHRHVRDAAGTVLVWGPGAEQGPYVDWEIRATQELKRPLLCLWLPELGPEVDVAQLPPRLQAMLQTGHAVCLPWAQVQAQPGLVLQALRQARAAGAQG